MRLPPTFSLYSFPSMKKNACACLSKEGEKVREIKGEREKKERKQKQKNGWEENEKGEEREEGLDLRLFFAG